MSERVNRIVFSRKKDATRDDLLQIIYKQINILLDAGYNCFITESDTDRICLEFCLSDPEVKDKDIPQPCWLYLDELEYLGQYQLKNMLDEARKAVSGIQEELQEAIQNQDIEEKPTKKKQTKKKEFDA